MVFAAEFAAIGGISAGVFASSRCWYARSVNASPILHDLVVLSEPSLMPYAGLLGIGRLFGTGAAVLTATLFDLSVVLPATFLLAWLIRPKT